MTTNQRKAISACMAGIPCRFDGQAKLTRAALELVERDEAILVCPEEMGGLPTPRRPAEIVGGDGEDVLLGHAKVLTADGEDVTAQYVAGAKKAADVVEDSKVNSALLKSKSPACGCSRIYDGSHSGTLVDGVGVFAAELKRRGIRVEEI